LSGAVLSVHVTLASEAAFEKSAALFDALFKCIVTDFGLANFFYLFGCWFFFFFF
jgi:hypothetical protein